MGAFIASLIVAALLILLNTCIIMLGWNVFGIHEAFGLPNATWGQAFLVALAFNILSTPSGRSS